jgi:hypothetical protein
LSITELNSNNIFGCALSGPGDLKIVAKKKYREYCKARNKVKKLTRKERKEREKQTAKTFGNL